MANVRILCALVGFALSSSSACAVVEGDERSGDEIRIGWMSAEAEHGESDQLNLLGHDGVRRVIAEVNQAGGIYGKQLVLKLNRDPVFGSGTTHEKYDDLKGRVDVLLTNGDGHLDSEIVRDAGRRRLVVINVLSASDAMGPAPFYFGVGVYVEGMMQTLARFITRRFPNGRIALVEDVRDPYSRYLRKMFNREVLSPLAAELAYGRSAAWPAGVVPGVLASNADAVVVFATSNAGGELVRDLRAAGYRGALIGSPNFGNGHFRDKARTAANGVFLVNLVPNNPAYARFAAREHRILDGERTTAAVTAHDAVVTLVAALEKTEGHVGDVLRDALTRPEPVTGTGIADLEIVNGEPVVISPDKVARTIRGAMFEYQGERLRRVADDD